MPTFGRFESCDLRPGRNVTETIYTARPVGARGRPQYTVRVLTLAQRDASTAERHFNEQVRIQQEVASSPKLRGHARHWLTVHDAGRSDERHFCVTDLYQTTLEELIGAKLKVRGDQLWRIVSSIVGGLVELKTVCDRPHGNLQAENVLVGPGRLNRASICLVAPLSGALAKSVSEEDDVRSIGNLIFHLVTGRQLKPLSDLPLESSAAWQRLGAKGEHWRKLCDQLLDFDAKLPTLEQLARNIRGLRPMRTGRAVVAAMILGMAAVGGYMAWEYSRPDPGPALVQSTSDQLARDRLDERTSAYRELVKIQKDISIAEERSAAPSIEARLEILRERLDPSKPISAEVTAPDWKAQTAESLRGDTTLSESELLEIQAWCEKDLAQAGDALSRLLPDWPLYQIAVDCNAWLSQDVFRSNKRAQELKALLGNLQSGQKLSVRLKGAYDLFRWAPLGRRLADMNAQRLLLPEDDAVLRRFDDHVAKLLAGDESLVLQSIEDLTKLAAELATVRKSTDIDWQAMKAYEIKPGGVYARAADRQTDLVALFTDWKSRASGDAYRKLPEETNPRTTWPLKIDEVRTRLNDLAGLPVQSTLQGQLDRVTEAVGLPWIGRFKDQIKEQDRELTLVLDGARAATESPAATDPRDKDKWLKTLQQIRDYLTPVVAAEKQDEKRLVRANADRIEQQLTQLEAGKWIKARESQITDEARRIDEALASAKDRALKLLGDVLAASELMLDDVDKNLKLVTGLDEEKGADYVKLASTLATHRDTLGTLRDSGLDKGDPRLVNDAGELEKKVTMLRTEVQAFLGRKPTVADPREVLNGLLGEIAKRATAGTLRITADQQDRIDKARAVLAGATDSWELRNCGRIKEQVDPHVAAVESILDPVLLAEANLPPEDGLREPVRPAWSALRKQLIDAARTAKEGLSSEADRRALADELTRVATLVVGRLREIESLSKLPFPDYDAAPKVLNREKINIIHAGEIRGLVARGIAAVRLVPATDTERHLGLQLDESRWPSWRTASSEFRTDHLNLGEWITALGKAEPLLVDEYAWNEPKGGVTLESLLAPMFAAGKEASIARMTAMYEKDEQGNTILAGNLPTAIRSLYDVAQSSDKKKLVNVMEGINLASQVTAWLRVGELDAQDNWPSNRAEWNVESVIRRKLMARLAELNKTEVDRARAPWLNEMLNAQGPTRWQRAVNAVGGSGGSKSQVRPFLTDLDAAADTFGVSLKLALAEPADHIKGLSDRLSALKQLTDASRFNLLMLHFESALSTVRNSEAKVRELVVAFAAATANLKLDDRLIRAIKDLKIQAESKEPAAPPWEKLGPGVAGWVPSEEGNIVTYRPPPGRFRTAPGPLRFIRIGDNTMLGTTEISVDQFRKIAEADSRFLEDLRSTMEPSERGRSFVCSWEGYGKGASTGSERRWLDVAISWQLIKDEIWERSSVGKDVTRTLRESTPKADHPMGYLPPHTAILFARHLNCRLPTSGEWTEARKLIGAASAINFRDVTWDGFQKQLLQMANENPPWTVVKQVFLPSDADIGKQATAVSGAKEDGFVWFAPVSQTGFESKGVYHLEGNVAEFVYDSAQEQEELNNATAASVVAMLEKDQPDSGNHSRLGVIGGSALSPVNLNGGTAVRFEFSAVRAYRSCFSDVGFRLAFSGKGNTPLIDRVEAWLKDQPYR